MFEPAQWYKAHALEYGFNVANIGPASVDLCLHDTVIDCFFSGSIQQKILHISDTAHFTFMPHHFYLCSTVEYIKVPITHCAFVQMRSSWARKGLGHKMAGFIDPGFEGQITLELTVDVPVVISQGERVVQIAYALLTRPTTAPYGGKYQGQQGPTAAYTDK